jgi:viroplasmin and RNaseH domain-containing protein
MLKPNNLLKVISMTKRCAAFAIYHGQCVGVFTCWDKVKMYVNGFPDARYKGFNSYEEAHMSFKENYPAIKAEIKAKKALKEKRALKAKYAFKAKAKGEGQGPEGVQEKQ